jgi:N6-L-threonylcarbamoyladenine synthase
LHLPSPELATDNAAMIAFAALHHLLAGEQSSVNVEILPQWQVDRRV